jgi:hypothetical protein
MDTYTLELRQKDAVTTNNNGDYESIVQEKILIEEGDSVVMKSVFIDTQASSNQKINVPDDLTLTFQWINYLQWSKGTGTFINAGLEFNPVDGSPYNYVTPSNQEYSEMKMISGDTADFDFITQLVFNTTTYKAGGQSKPFDLTITYTNEKDVVTNKILSIPAYQNQLTPHTYGITILYKRAEGLKFSPSDLTQFGVVLDTKIFEVPADHIVGSPELYTKNLTLEKGAYSPVDLCNAINKGLTEQVSISDGDYSLYGNQFLQVKPRGGNYMVAIGQNQLLRGGAANVFEPFLTPPNGTPAGERLLVGADQIELSFSDSTQKFLWNQIHMSVYDDTGAPVNSYNPDGVVLKKAGGIFWTHLGAKDSNGNYFDFWSNLLGFDLTKLYPQESLNLIKGIYWRPANANRDIAAPAYNLQAGQNITEGLSTIGALVPTSKDAQTAAGGYFNPLTGVVENPTNGKNTAIEAATSTLQAAQRFGYFLIEVNAKFLGKFVQKDQMKNNIRAIVGRYYELNSYTSGSQGDSLLYTHIGTPMYLESFKCRILDSDQNLAPNLGPDNTIFLQIVKNPKNTELGQVESAVQGQDKK